jgi:hypothetical protein
MAAEKRAADEGKDTDPEAPPRCGRMPDRTVAAIVNAASIATPCPIKISRFELASWDPDARSGFAETTRASGARAHTKTPQKAIA